MKFRSPLAQVLYKTKSIRAFYFSRLHLQQNCDFGAQAADHKLPKVFILLCISHNPESSGREEEEQAVPTGDSYTATSHPRGKGNKQFPVLCSSGM